MSKEGKEIPMNEEKFHSQMEFKQDEYGKEILLKNGKFQVMMQWEKPYMQACIDALKPFGDVLEIGFGLGFSATQIQTYRPKSHTIIEYDPEVAKRARKWAEDFSNITIIESTWQEVLPSLGVFDCIFFDDYPLYSDRQEQKMLEEKEEMLSLLQEGKETIAWVEQTLPSLKTVKYQDDDLTSFLKEVEKTDVTNCPARPLEIVRFLQELFNDNQISTQQYETYAKPFIEKLSPNEKERLFSTSKPKSPYVFSGENDRLFTFLSACLNKHMIKGSKFSCFLSSSQSKFEDKRFFNEIITNPYLDYKEEVIQVDVPDNCNYYQDNQALVITIEKLGE